MLGAAAAEPGPEEGGYSAVVRRQRDGLFRLAWLLTADRSWAEELVADAFVATYPAWARGDVDDERAYLRRALANRFRSGVRRRALERRVAAVRFVPPPRDDLAESVVRLTAVHRALLGLSPRQRAVVVLYYFEDLSERDVAAQLAIGPGAVKTHLSRARAHLRRALADPEGGSNG